MTEPLGFDLEALAIGDVVTFYDDGNVLTLEVVKVGEERILKLTAATGYLERSVGEEWALMGIARAGDSGEELNKRWDVDQAQGFYATSILVTVVVFKVEGVLTSFPLADATYARAAI